MPDQGDTSSASASSFGGGEDTLVSKLVLKHKLATTQEIKSCLVRKKQLADRGQDKPLSEVLVEQGCVTAAQMQRLIADADQKPAKQLFPGYQLLDKLGKGAMATVYKARQLSLDRVVAVKVLPHRYSENAEFVDRFYREGKAAAKLNHRNIVQAIDVGEAGGYHYFVMEYVDGYTVHDVLAKSKRYPESEAVDLILQIADALAHAHARGLVHRDVKPKNIMLTRDGVAKLADMGLAREVSDTRLAQSEAGRAYGTPYYISPEQIRGEVDIDFRADIYSLGATFYHMVAGRVPFDAPNPTAVMLKHLREQLTPPDHINPELSVGCAEIIEVMMAKRREDRYQSTEEMLEDLRAVREGRPPVHARAIFDVNELANLEEQGSPAEPPVHGSAAAAAQMVAGWKVAVAVLAMLLVLSLIVNVVLLLGS
ncbi:MAG: serine/threonine protein kinase [Phycisphaerae bacterium]|nr:serine/threonine protein kinase [Phycisphaerae bacterium]